jgi:hypothetical protein
MSEILGTATVLFVHFSEHVALLHCLALDETEPFLPNWRFQQRRAANRKRREDALMTCLPYFMVPRSQSVLGSAPIKREKVPDWPPHFLARCADVYCANRGQRLRHAGFSDLSCTTYSSAHSSFLISPETLTQNPLLTLPVPLFGRSVSDSSTRRGAL